MNISEGSLCDIKVKTHHMSTTIHTHPHLLHIQTSMLMLARTLMHIQTQLHIATILRPGNVCGGKKVPTDMPILLLLLDAEVLLMQRLPLSLTPAAEEGMDHICLQMETVLTIMLPYSTRPVLFKDGS